MQIFLTKGLMQGFLYVPESETEAGLWHGRPHIVSINGIVPQGFHHTVGCMCLALSDVMR